MKRIYLLLLTRRIELLLTTISTGILVYFLWFHWQLGLYRYFDVDEFAHLHWAAQMAAGQKPYIDFFLFFPPGFYVFLMPLFWFGSGIAPIVMGRILEFVVFTGVIGISIALFWYVRRAWSALLVGVILAFLPLPFDKFIEIRPDTLATLLVLLGMLFQIRSMRTFRKRVDPYYGLLGRSGWWAGVMYGASILVLPKVIPHVVFAAGVLVARDIWEKYCDLRHGCAPKYNSFPFSAGLVVPFVLFGVWALTLGNIGQVVYSLTTLPLEANRISRTFIMMPDLFFYPNEIFYGSGGYGISLLANHGVWIIGLLFGLYRLLTPSFPGGKQGIWEELLIAGSFMVNVVFYVLIVPLKHAQYLIPIAVFVAWFIADAANAFWIRVRQRPIGQILFFALLLVGYGVLFQAFMLSVRPKFAWTNTRDLKVLDALFTSIPKTEFLLDLDGRTMYYPSPYPVCCLPFGQFAPFLSRTLPPLSDSLEQTMTKYIYQGQLQRVTTLLAEDQEYIRTRYEPYQGNVELLVRK